MSRYQRTINSGVQYIVENIAGLEDVYALSLCTYVLNLAKNQYEETAFYALESKAHDNGQAGMKWWSKAVPEDDKNPWYSLPRSVDVEMTSYVLLTYLRRNLVNDAIPLMKWLVTQRNREGGFASTQVNRRNFCKNIYREFQKEATISTSDLIIGHSNWDTSSGQTRRKISIEG